MLPRSMIQRKLNWQRGTRDVLKQAGLKRLK